MFSVGDKVVYGRTGVCIVEAVEQKESDSGEVRYYYFLRPVYQRLCITVAADNPKTNIRPIVTKLEADRLIDSMPTAQSQPFYCQNLSQLKEYYRVHMKNESCEEMVDLLVGLHKKRCEAEAAKKKFGAVDERVMNETMDLLFGEFAAALDIDKKGVSQYIQRRLELSV